jgi:uncharacterized protein (TIGR00369 family)
MDTLAFDLEEVAPGRVAVRGRPSPGLLNTIGVVHGGFAVTLLDSAMGSAVQTTLSPTETFTTLEVKVNFVRAITPDTGPVLAQGVVVHRGRTTATAEGRLRAAGDRALLAHGSCTCLLRRL